MSKGTILLILILGLALFLRIWGLDYGLPYFLVNDERSLVYGALKMGELKTLVPAFRAEDFRVLHYAPLMSYIYLVFLAPFVLIQYLFGSFANFSEISRYFTINPGPIWLVARFANALMGVAAVYLIYLIGKKALNRWVGFICSLFLTFSFLHIQFSHFTRIWGPTLFFVSLIMLLSLYIYKSPKMKYYLLAGLAGGLSFGTNYVAPAALFIFLMAHFLNKQTSFWKKFTSRNLWLFAAVFIILVAVFILIYPQLFIGWTGLNRLEGALAANRSFTELLTVFVFYIKILFFYEPVILIISLAGLIFLLFKSWRTLLVALSWPIFWILVVYFIVHGAEIGGRPHTHYILVVIPWLAILAGLTLHHLIAKFSLIAKCAIVALVFIYPLAVAVQYDRLLAQKDTRILAKEWIEEHIATGAKIISKVGGVNPIPTKEAILFQQELDKDSLRAVDLALLNLSAKDYPQPAYDILKWAYVDKEKPLPDKNYQYFLVAFWDEREVLSEEKLINRGRLIQEFKQGQSERAEDVHGNKSFFRPISALFLLERLGPIVRIYEL